MQFDILKIRVEKKQSREKKNSEGATEIASFSFWGGSMVRATVLEKLGLYEEHREDEAEAEGEVKSEESEPEE